MSYSLRGATVYVPFSAYAFCADSQDVCALWPCRCIAIYMFLFASQCKSGVYVCVCVCVCVCVLYRKGLVQLQMIGNVSWWTQIADHDTVTTNNCPELGEPKP